jgi:hypothetical protein
MSDRPKSHAHEHDDPDAPPTEEEVLASQRLRDALDRPTSAPSDDLDLVKSLRAAWSPDPLDEGVHAKMLDDVPMSADELLLAEELRLGLANDDAVIALRAAWAPAPLDDAEHRRIVEKALEAPAGAKVIELRSRPKRSVRVVVATTTTVLAFAAGIVLWITTTAQQADVPLARARSTQPLFDEPFKAGETSARIDKIAIARASDYRSNRFTKWGVR